MKNVLKGIIWIITFPWDVICWMIVLFFRLFWGSKLWWKGGLWTELKPESWPSRTWYRYKFHGRFIQNPTSKWGINGRWKTWGGTCLGHGGFYGPGVSQGKKIDTSVEYHEHVHVEQYEVGMVRGFLIGLFVFGIFIEHFTVLGLIAGSIIWITGFLHTMIPAWIVGFLRGEGAYSGSITEEHASAMTALRGYLKDK